MRASRLIPSLWKLQSAVRLWLQAREVAAAQRAAREFVERDTDPAPRSMRHVFNVYEPYQPGREAFTRLRVPQCVFCQQFRSEKNEQERCPWFSQ